MFCPKCGNQNADTNRFCNKCGKELPARAHIRQPVPPNFAPQHSSDFVGQVLDGKYRIDAKLGSGGMGDVYRATRLFIGDTVALKILHPHLARDPQATERFRREAVMATKLRHRNVVGIYDVGISAAHNVPYILMEMAEGYTLRQIINQYGVLPLDFAVTVTTQVCSALDDAHGLGIVHRDIKPENIVANQTTTGWYIKVLDFGIAKLYNQGDIGLTLDGNAMGTPQYMSPEQCLGENLDARSDIYSVGIVLYEMLTGTVPFKSPTASAIAIHQVNSPPQAPRLINDKIHPGVEFVVLKSLCKQPEFRQQKASELAQDLIKAATVAFKSGFTSVPAAPIPAPDVVPEFEASNPDDSQARPPSNEMQNAPSPPKAEKKIKRQQSKNNPDIEIETELPVESPAELLDLSSLVVAPGTPVEPSDSDSDRQPDPQRDHAMLFELALEFEAAETEMAIEQPVEVHPPQTPFISPETHVEATEAETETETGAEVQTEIQVATDRPVTDEPTLELEAVETEMAIEAQDEMPNTLSPVLTPEVTAAATESETDEPIIDLSTLGFASPETKKIVDAPIEMPDLPLPVSVTEIPVEAYETELDFPNVGGPVDRIAPAESKTVVELPAEVSNPHSPLIIPESPVETCGDEPDIPVIEEPAAKTAGFETVRSEHAVEPSLESALVRGETEETNGVDWDISGGLEDSELRSKELLSDDVPSNGEGAKADPVEAVVEETISLPVSLPDDVDTPTIQHPGTDRVPTFGGAAGIKGTKSKALILIAMGGVILLSVVVGIGYLYSIPRTRSDATDNPAQPPTISAIVPDGMVYIQGGEFTMGRDDGKIPEEGPAHTATVGPFYLDKYEVTNEKYAEFVQATNHKAPPGWKNGNFPNGKGKLPVVGVDWIDATEFARWAKKRLPTEEEWEFAARGNDARLYPWGNDWKSGVANIAGASPTFVEVGKFTGMSPFGIFDMVGNAGEWTSSDFKTYAGGQPSARYAGKKDLKTRRGADFETEKQFATTTFRFGLEATGAKYDRTGFRCAMDITK